MSKYFRVSVSVNLKGFLIFSILDDISLSKSVKFGVLSLDWNSFFFWRKVDSIDCKSL